MSTVDAFVLLIFTKNYHLFCIKVGRKFSKINFHVILRQILFLTSASTTKLKVYDNIFKIPATTGFEEFIE